MEDSLGDIAKQLQQNKTEKPGTSKDQGGGIPAYEILGEIGRGGMGVVYRARHRTLDRIDAVKLILSGNFAQEQEVRRFMEEARTVAKIRHQNVVLVYDAGKNQDGNCYFSMEYVPGKTLKDAIKDREVTAERALEITRALAAALSYAHGQGIIHRDIKPSNVLLDLSGNPKLMDFGLAKSSSGEKLTMSGAVLGTPQYMPPEQAEGKTREIDCRSDLYSLGALLYEALTARPPFEGDNAPYILYQVVHVQPLPPSQLNPSVDPALDGICLKALAKKPADRYQNAAELERAIVGYLESRRPAQNEDDENRDVLIKLACIHQSDPPFGIKIWTEKGQAMKTRNIALVPKIHKAQHCVGDKITVYFSAERDCYLNLIDIGPTKDITLLFPNQFAQENQIKAGHIYRFPREEDGFEFELQPPTGKETVKAIATLEPINLLDVNPAQIGEVFYSVQKKERMRNIAIIAKKLNGESCTKWSEAKCEFDVMSGPGTV